MRPGTRDSGSKQGVVDAIRCFHSHGDITPADPRIETTPGFEAPPMLLASDLQGGQLEMYLVCWRSLLGLAGLQSPAGLGVVQGWWATVHTQVFLEHPLSVAGDP